MQNKPQFKKIRNAFEEQIINGNPHDISMNTVPKANRISITSERLKAIYDAFSEVTGDSSYANWLRYSA